MHANAFTQIVKCNMYYLAYPYTPRRLPLFESNLNSDPGNGHEGLDGGHVSHGAVEARSRHGRNGRAQRKTPRGHGTV